MTHFSLSSHNVLSNINRNNITIPKASLERRNEFVFNLSWRKAFSDNCLMGTPSFTTTLAVVVCATRSLWRMCTSHVFDTILFTGGSTFFFMFAFLDVVSLRKMGPSLTQ